MKYLYPLPLMIVLTIAGCANPAPVGTDTQACIKYRAMMSAPISPAAAEALRQQCTQSRKSGSRDHE